MTRVADKLGRKPVLYSGHLIKEKLGNKTDAFFGSHRLWLAQYGPDPVVQKSLEYILAVAIHRQDNRSQAKPGARASRGHKGQP